MSIFDCCDWVQDPKNVLYVYKTKLGQPYFQSFVNHHVCSDSLLTQLIISYYMNAAVMCEFSKEEFTSGMLKMGCDSVAKLKAKIPELRKEIKSNERFRELYNFAYLFAREVSRNVACMASQVLSL